jgi:hypothetical protein
MPTDRTTGDRTDRTDRTDLAQAQLGEFKRILDAAQDALPMDVECATAQGMDRDVVEGLHDALSETIRALLMLGEVAQTLAGRVSDLSQRVAQIEARIEQVLAAGRRLAGLTAADTAADTAAHSAYHTPRGWE